MTILRGAWPIVAAAASPCATCTLPCGLLSSTRPSSTVSDVSAPLTVIVQSVPRMAAVAAGVTTSTPGPPRSARAQIVPASSSSTASLPGFIWRTRREELRPRRICVRSANRIASWPVALVRKTSPVKRSCCRSTKRQFDTSMKRTSSPVLRAMTDATASASRATGSADAGANAPPAPKSSVTLPH